MIPCVLSARGEYLCREKEVSFPCPSYFDPFCRISYNNTEIVKTSEINFCKACKKNSAIFAAPGVCQNYPKNATFCDPRTVLIGFSCLKDYKPVCGVDYSGIEVTYYNSCMACLSEDIVFFADGECLSENRK